MAEPITITITLPPESQRVVANMREFPQEFMQAIRRGMDRGLAIVRGRIQRERLSGTGPYSVAEHRLGARSHRLQRSTINQPAVIRGNSILGQIGASASNRGFPYGLAHEYGAVIRGKPFLVFKIGDRVIRTKQVIIPERAPFRTEMESPQTAQTFTEEIISEIDKAVSKL